jgi:methyl-accepting chemotaxis protein
MNRVSQRQLLAVGVLGLGALVLVLFLGVESKTMVGAVAYLLVASFLVISSGGDGGSTELVETIASSVRRMVDGRRPEPPREAPPAVVRLYEELAEAHDALKVAKEGGLNRDELSEAAASLGSALRSLTDGVAQQLNASDETARYIKEMTSSQREIAEHVEVLATSAEESSSSVIQMTATNEQVAGNIVDLATSVRETVASIEEMAYSIKEVAKNVDALSLTAEETSSSMNEMDVSIDQVQSNANETARLSEEVAQDAERGAEAILKTIGEI